MGHGSDQVDISRFSRQMAAARLNTLISVPLDPAPVYAKSTVTLPDGSIYPLYTDANNKIVADGNDNGWCAMLVMMLRGATLSLTTDGDDGTPINVAAPLHPDGTSDRPGLVRIFQMISPLLCSGCFSATLSFPPTQEELATELDKIVSGL